VFKGLIKPHALPLRHPV